jgi:outer membrane protein
MKRIAFALAACLAFTLPASTQSQQVTRVGICDFTKVLTTAYRDTKAYRDYEQARTDYNKDVTARTKEITDLQSQKLDADKAGNKNQSLSLDKSILEKQTDLDYYKRVKGATLQQQGNLLLTGPVLKDILDVVTFVSEAGGYALILRSDGAYKDIILFRLPEVDITTDVITEIFKRQGKTYNPSAGQ